MNMIGMNTAASDTVIDRIVKPISADPSIAARYGFLPISMCRTIFSSTNDRVVDDEADRQRERPSTTGCRG
jgi:hypothetical protein